MNTIADNTNPDRQRIDPQDEEERDGDEPDIDDSVLCCPECETPNQFGELCNRCRSEVQAEGRDYLGGD